MQTLDEILYARANATYQAKLQSSLDASTWTKENREEKLQQFRKGAEGVSEDALTFTKELLETEIDGKPVLYWKILEQFINIEAEVLENLRIQLDYVEEVELSKQPIDYEWLSKVRRQRVVEALDLAIKIENVLEEVGESEEL